MQVPFIDIRRFEPGFVEGFLSDVERLVRNTEFIGGPTVTACEKELAAFCGTPHAALCANGTDAIQLALRACGVGPGDVVVIPDMTFWATFEAVVNVGARPATVDVDPDTLHLSATALGEAIDRFRPKACLLVHLYGWAAPDTAKIRTLCRDRGVRLVEDSAQAFGTVFEGTPLFAGADVSTSSFYPAKVLGASGDSGGVFSRDAGFDALIRKLLNHGRKDHYAYDRIGWNSRGGAYEAAYLRHGLKHLDARIASRRRVTQIFRDELKGTVLDMKAPAASVRENGYASVALVEPKVRERLRAHLDKSGVGSGVIYPGAMSEQEGADGWLAGAISHGHARTIGQSVLNLPCFAGMTDREIEYVIATVKNFK